MAYDYLSDLTAAEIAVTTSTTATISRHHHVTISSAATLTLPPVSGNTDKFISVLVDPTSTALLTLKGNGSELINGLNTRTLWAKESAWLYCDGSAWYKRAGRSRAMRCQLSYSSSFTAVSGTQYDVPFDTVDSDPTGLMADVANHRIEILRPNPYLVSIWNVAFNNIQTAGGSILYTQPYILRGMSDIGQPGQYLTGTNSTWYWRPSNATVVDGEVGDFIHAVVFQNTIQGGGGGVDQTETNGFLFVVEIIGIW